MVKTKIKCRLSKAKFDAVIFDLDGVITQSAKIHAKAWKEMFDAYLKNLKPFDIEKDYANYIDGKPRYEGVKSFLESRDIYLPYGCPEDPPGKETICGLGNRKNVLFRKQLHKQGVQVYETSIELVHTLINAGFKVGLVTSSKNGAEILKIAGIAHLFKVHVDGVFAEQQHLKGKPAPDFFLAAARELNVSPSKAVIIEDALSGVKAGSLGHFGCVIGVDRKNHEEELRKEGANIVVKDLAEIEVEL